MLARSVVAQFIGGGRPIRSLGNNPFAAAIFPAGIVALTRLKYLYARAVLPRSECWAVTNAPFRGFRKCNFTGRVPSAISMLTLFTRLCAHSQARLWPKDAQRPPCWRAQSRCVPSAHAFYASAQRHVLTNARLLEYLHTRTQCMLRLCICGGPDRTLNANMLTGPFPAGISSLTRLEDLYAPASGPMPSTSWCDSCFGAGRFPRTASAAAFPPPSPHSGRSRTCTHP
jgi:hypothetical protein